MDEIRDILAATDLSESSDAVVKTAAELARLSGAMLHVLHALPLAAPIPMPALGLEPRIDLPLYEQQRLEARRRLDEQVGRTVDAGQRVAAALVEGEGAARAIRGRAEEVEADLVVIGPHTRGGGGLLGTTADEVLRSAPVPVLVARGAAPVPTRRVLAAADPTERSAGILAAALRWAAAFAPPDGGPAEVHVVHALTELVTGEMPFGRATVEPGANADLAEARERAGGAGGAAVRNQVLWGGRVEETILAYAREWGAQLLVAGSHGRGAVGRALLGGTSSALAREAPCPVLLLPPSLWAEGVREPEDAVSH